MAYILLETLLPLLVSATVILIVHPKLVKIAMLKKIVDNPNARRLNKEPIPVLGGVGIFLGVVLATVVSCGLLKQEFPVDIFAAGLLIMYAGAIDDMFSIKPSSKFVVQILAVLLLIFGGGETINNLNGLWGVYLLPSWVTYPLTFVALVGIINGFNLMDGVDGLLSSYSVIVSVICGILFLQFGVAWQTALMFAVAGALVPFFLQNVFGRKYKMFLGDAGSMVLGVLFASIIVQIIDRGPEMHVKGVVSFVLAIFSIPIFDTLRVMIARMLKGRSPFSPDKTHMHHLFTGMGFSHIMVTTMVLIINFIPLVVWLILEGVATVSLTMQFYIVVATCIVLNLGVWFGVNSWRRRNPHKSIRLQEHNQAARVRHLGTVKKIQRLLDRW